MPGQVKFAKAPDGFDVLYDGQVVGVIAHDGEWFVSFDESDPGEPFATLKEAKRYAQDVLHERDEEMTIRAKWAMDGARTLAEDASMLRAMADDLDKLAAEGWELREGVADDYGVAVRTR